MKIKVVKHEKTRKQKLIATKESNLGLLVTRYPEVADIMLEWGLHCVGCFANSFDTIEAGAQIHGLDEDDIQEMLSEINTCIHQIENQDEPKP